MDSNEEEELRFEISQLEEQIAQARQNAQQHQPQDPTHTVSSQSHHSPARGKGGYRGRGYPPSRYSPYGFRGRGHFTAPVARNRTAVFKNSATTADREANGGDSSAWVSKQTPFHKQLINRNVFLQNAEERTQAAKETVERKQIERDMKERQRLQRYLHTPSADPAVSVHHKPQEIEIGGIPFRVANDGSKLLRLTQNASQTPKTAKVAGVQFFRSKNGNLYRAGLVKMKKPQPNKKSSRLCPHFTTTGWCSSGTACKYVHDPNKVAICKEYLQKGTCPKGFDCDLSHDPTPNRVPACAYFLRGNCTNENCRYAHVNVNPTAPVCRDFGSLGYCDKGASCTERHVNECPDFANTGICRMKDCRLPHIERASTMRKRAQTGDGGADDEGKVADISSDEEYDQIDSDDIDSDDIDDTMSQTSRAFSQQQDFIKV